MRHVMQSARPVGLLEITATISLVAGAVWLAGRRTEAAIRRLGRRAEESAILNEVRANGKLLRQITESTAVDSYASAYLAGVEDRNQRH